ncbi:tape measure protein [Mammaliicoccus sciuri]
MNNLRDMIVSIAFKDNASKAVQEVNKSMDAAKKAFSSSSTSAMKTSDAVKDVGKAMKTASTETKKTNSGFKTTATTMKAVQSAFKRSNSDVTKLTGTFRTAGSAMKTVASSAKPISPELNRVQRAMKSVGDASKTAKTAIGSFATGGLNRLKGATVTGVSRLANDFRALPGVVGGAARKVGSSITNFITAPLRGAVGMVQQYAGALGLLSGGALAASGMARLSAIENAKTSLSVMMGDAGKASKFMDEVLAFAKTTPFAFPDLAETARNLIAFGMDEAKVVPTMKAIGDAAAASGKGSEGLNQVASAFGDMQIAGYLGMDQINRLQAGGVPALKILANQFGVTTDAMKKNISDGKVDSVKAIDQLVEGMQKGTKGVAGETAKMAGIMEETKKNWTGSVDSLKSSISSTMATLLEPVKPHIQNAMAWFGDTFSKLPDVVFGAYEMIKPIIKQLKPMFEGTFTGMSELIEPIKESFVTIGSAVLDFINNVLLPNMPLIKETISDAFTTIAPVVENVASIFMDIWDVVSGLVTEVILPLIPIVSDIITSSFDAIQPVVSTVATVFGTVKDVVMFLVNNVVVPLIPILSSVIQTAFDIVNPILRIAKSLFDAVWTVIEFLVTGIILPLVPGIADVFTGMWGILKPILDGMVSIFNGIADAIQWAVDKFKSFADAAKNFKMPKIGLPSFLGGNGLIQLPGHATGLGRVPYDEYPMLAHKDEAVLTAEQSNALRAAGMLKGDGTGPTLDMSRGSSSPVSTSTTSATHNNNTFHFHISGHAEDIGRRVRDEIEALFGRMNAVTE